MFNGCKSDALKVSQKFVLMITLTLRFGRLVFNLHIYFVIRLPVFCAGLLASEPRNFFGLKFNLDLQL
jgi:hypothetical protein